MRVQNTSGLVQGDNYTHNIVQQLLPVLKSNSDKPQKNRIGPICTIIKLLMNVYSSWHIHTLKDQYLAPFSTLRLTSNLGNAFPCLS